MNNRSPFSSLPILVTGAAGFIGARFVERMNRRGQRVISVDHLDYFSERTEHRGIDFGLKVDREKLFRWLEEKSWKGNPPISAVVHLGACTDTTEMDEGYLRRMNVDYSKTLWSYCARHELPFVYASSAATYGEGELGYDDSDENLTARLRPLNPYGESKRAFDEWALYEESQTRFPPSWAGFKFFNVYGFGERHKGKMASVVLHAYDQIRATGGAKLFQSHKEGIAHGEQKRDFVYVEDLVSVLEFALERPIPRGLYNLGTGTARSFLDLVRSTFRSLQQPEKIEFIPTPESLRARYQYFTEAKMGKLRAAGYAAPFRSLEEGVNDYVLRLKALK